MNNLLFGVDISKVVRYSIFCFINETLEMFSIECNTLDKVQNEINRFSAIYGVTKIALTVLCHLDDGSTQAFKFPGVKEQTLEEMKNETEDILRRLVEKINLEGWDED